MLCEFLLYSNVNQLYGQRESALCTAWLIRRVKWHKSRYRNVQYIDGVVKLWSLPSSIFKVDLFIPKQSTHSDESLYIHQWYKIQGFTLPILIIYSPAKKKKKKELNLIKMYGSSWGNQVCLKDGTLKWEWSSFNYTTIGYSYIQTLFTFIFL